MKSLLLLGRKKILIVSLVLLIFLISFSYFFISSSKHAGTPTPSKTTRKEVAGVKITPSSSPTIFPTNTILSSVSDKQFAQVIKVVDGDTIHVMLGGKSETIRIIGINTPETVDPRKTVECFGHEASQKAKAYFLNAQNKIWLESDPTQGERDKYQRLLRYVFTKNGSEDYGKMMIQTGYAYEYTYQTPYKYQAIYKQAQKEAETKGLGLWSPSTCNGQKINTTQSRTVPSNNPNSQNPPQPQSGNTTTDKDCKDFTTHADAQTYFLSKGGNPTNNVDKLDSDHDGDACEGLP